MNESLDIQEHARDESFRIAIGEIARITKERNVLAARVERLEVALKEAMKIATDDNPYRITGEMDMYEILQEALEDS